MFDERSSFVLDAAAISATTTIPIVTPSTARSFRVERVELMSIATYADDAANYYVLTLQKGATVIGTWSTLTGANGAITGGTPVTLTLSGTDAALVLAGGDVLSLVATKHASAANITPRLVVHGKFVS
jgi:hypothetical protein